MSCNFYTHFPINFKFYYFNRYNRDTLMKFQKHSYNPRNMFIRKKILWYREITRYSVRVHVYFAEIIILFSCNLRIIHNSSPFQPVKRLKREKRKVEKALETRTSSSQWQIIAFDHPFSIAKRVILIAVILNRRGRTVLRAIHVC